MKEERITFKSGSGELTLEGMIALPDGAGSHRAAVVCHPHPLYGGSMHNNVVDAVLEALHASGFATLRFNFRGVGQSEGEFDNGMGEAADAVAAVRFLTTHKGVGDAGAVLAGYSFGAATAVRAAGGVEEVAAIVTVALPLGMIDPTALGAIAKPIVLLAGDRDSYCPANDLAALAGRLGPLARLKLIPGADHFFGGREPEIVAALGEALATLQ
ncbi:MAG TPA: alpha/beta fold hydrolase [Candidatus Binataceae bacterium]|nr:alpha/beta fold hydrolase [Candidatus Binataceae bacterium]HVB80859.1 alpha/beta fold hydrolase [Candidatus Binataceae bacterium]